MLLIIFVLAVDDFSINNPMKPEWAMMSFCHTIYKDIFGADFWVWIFWKRSCFDVLKALLRNLIENDFSCKPIWGRFYWFKKDFLWYLFDASSAPVFLYASCSLTYLAVIFTDLIQFNNTNNLYLLICRSARFRRNFLVYLLQGCFKTWYAELALMYKVICWMHCLGRRYFGWLPRAAKYFFDPVLFVYFLS